MSTSQLQVTSRADRWNEHSQALRGRSVRGCRERRCRQGPADPDSEPPDVGHANPAHREPRLQPVGVQFVILTVIQGLVPPCH